VCGHTRIQHTKRAHTHTVTGGRTHKEHTQQGTAHPQRAHTHTVGHTKHTQTRRGEHTQGGTTQTHTSRGGGTAHTEHSPRTRRSAYRGTKNTGGHSTGHTAQGTQHRAHSTGHTTQGTQHRAHSTGHTAQGTPISAEALLGEAGGGGVKHSPAPWPPLAAAAAAAAASNLTDVDVVEVDGGAAPVPRHRPQHVDGARLLALLPHVLGRHGLRHRACTTRDGLHSTAQHNSTAQHSRAQHTAAHRNRTTPQQQHKA
jgi:hypothetical protein